jgi:ribosomal protein S7
MVARLRDISEKYRSTRLQNDALFDSLTLQTFFNKFIKRGKKSVSRRHLYMALTRHRMLSPNHNIYPTFFRHVKGLSRNIKLVLRRKGKQFLPVPVPAFRNKATVAVLQQLAGYVKKDKAFDLELRICNQLHDITINGRDSLTFRDLSDYNRLVYDARVNLEKR